MREGIQPGAGGDRPWHADGQFRVGDDDRGQHLGVKDDLLHMGFRVGDDAGAPHLGPGAGSGGDGDDRGNARRIGPRPPVADILVIPDGPGLARHEGDHLAKVEARTAAEGDDPVMPARLVDLQPGGKVLLVRVRVDIGEDRAAKPGGLHDIQRRGGDRQVAQAPVGDQQRALHAGLCAGLGQFCNAACAEFDRGRVGPVSGETHLVTFLRW